MRTNTLIRSAALAGLLLAGTAYADDMFPPPWRGQPDTTMQEWDFSPSSPTAPTQVFNPFGTPQFNPSSGGPTVTAPGSTSTGWWVIPAGGSISFIIPNGNEPPPHSKIVYVQISFSGSIDVSVAGPGFDFGPSTTTTTPGHAPGGESYQSFNYIWPDGCPPFETVTIHNPSTVNLTYINQVVIDTICVPTPGSAAVLGIGMLAVARRKRA